MSGMDRLTELRRSASFLRALHTQACFEQGNHKDEVDTPYSLGADAIDQEARRASQAAPAPDDQFVTTLPQEAFDAFAKACDEAPAPSDALREENARLAARILHLEGMVKVAKNQARNNRVMAAIGTLTDALSTPTEERQ